MNTENEGLNSDSVPNVAVHSTPVDSTQPPQKNMKRLTIILIALGIFSILVGIVLVKRQSQRDSESVIPDIGQEETISPTTPIATPTSSATLPTNPPITEIPLTISSPIPDTTTNTASITVRGKTNPRAEVFINEAEVVADASGNFSAQITLDEGENLIIITAIDPEGNVSEKELVITYEIEE